LAVVIARRGDSHAGGKRGERVAASPAAEVSERADRLISARVTSCVSIRWNVSPAGRWAAGVCRRL
jgi:hypothetical protein